MTPEEHAFIEEIVQLSKKYNLSLSHEDGQGGFMVGPYYEDNIEWIRAAIHIEEDKG